MAQENDTSQNTVYAKISSVSYSPTGDIERVEFRDQITNELLATVDTSDQLGDLIRVDWPTNVSRNAQVIVVCKTVSSGSPNVKLTVGGAS